MAEPIASLQKINRDANAAARQGVPLNAANRYPKYSAAWEEFNAVYTLAYAERCLEAA